MKNRNKQSAIAFGITGLASFVTFLVMFGVVYATIDITWLFMPATLILFLSVIGLVVAAVGGIVTGIIALTKMSNTKTA